jgi:mannose-6-phosphate isomerase-like protein (cupin superfamily)
MTGYLTTAERITALGPAYERVLVTGETMQLVALTLDPGEETGLVTHAEADQLVVFLTGWPIEVTVAGEHHQVSAGTVLLVPKGVEHRFVNSGSLPVTILSAFAPPELPEGAVMETRS